MAPPPPPPISPSVPSSGPLDRRSVAVAHDAMDSPGRRHSRTAAREYRLLVSADDDDDDDDDDGRSVVVVVIISGFLRRIVPVGDGVGFSFGQVFNPGQVRDSGTRPRNVRT